MLECGVGHFSVRTARARSSWRGRLPRPDPIDPNRVADTLGSRTRSRRESVHSFIGVESAGWESNECGSTGAPPLFMIALSAPSKRIESVLLDPHTSQVIGHPAAVIEPYALLPFPLRHRGAVGAWRATVASFGQWAVSCIQQPDEWRGGPPRIDDVEQAAIPAIRTFGTRARSRRFPCGSPGRDVVCECTARRRRDVAGGLRLVGASLGRDLRLGDLLVFVGGPGRPLLRPHEVKGRARPDGHGDTFFATRVASFKCSFQRSV